MLARSALSRSAAALRQQSPSTVSSIRSLTTSSVGSLTRPRLVSSVPAASHLFRRYRSTEPPSPLRSVPSAAENVGAPPIDTKKGKFYESVDEAVKDIKSGSVVLSAGE